ncbi:MAG: Ger(x)C family spore germination protein [Bacillota bacterium]|nr:Ger(x)C family spore germination protein [Bacillota bacterium]
MKKIIWLISLVTFTFFFTSCWDYTEYEQMAQIYSLGIDLDIRTKEVTVTLQFIPITKSSGEKSAEINRGTVYSASDATIMGAITKLQQASTNKLFYGYIQVLVIGEDAAKYIMKDIVEHFERTPNTRNSIGIVIVPGKAEGVIATRDPNSVTSSGKKIRMFLNSYQSNGSTYLVTLRDFLQMMTRQGYEPVAPKIITTSLVDDPGEATGGEKNGIRFAVEKKGNLMAGGMAVFKKDKLVGWLNNKETMGLNWILGNKINAFKVTDRGDVKLSDGNTDRLSIHDELKKTLYFYITKSGRKVKVRIENNKPVVYLDIKIEAALRKYYSVGGDEYIDPEIVGSLGKKLESSIYSDVTAALKKGKDELNSDIFGFGFNFYRQHPKVWHKYYEKAWESEFSSIPVRVNIKVKVNNTGTNIKKFFIK